MSPSTPSIRQVRTRASTSLTTRYISKGLPNPFRPYPPTRHCRCSLSRAAASSSPATMTSPTSCSNASRTLPPTTSCPSIRPRTTIPMTCTPYRSKSPRPATPPVPALSTTPNPDLNSPVAAAFSSNGRHSATRTCAPESPHLHLPCHSAAFHPALRGSNANLLLPLFLPPT